MILNHNGEEGADAEDKEKDTQTPVIRLDRQLEYEGDILEIYEDRILANSYEARWDFVHHDSAAAVLPVADDGETLTVCQYRNTLDRYTLEVPVGKLDEPGEPKMECVFRESKGETGYRVESPENLEYPVSSTMVVAFCDEAIDIFVAHNLIPSHRYLDEDEVISVVPCNLEELEDMIYTGKIMDSETIATIMAYARGYRFEDKKDSMVRGQAINREFLSCSSEEEVAADMFLTCKLRQEDDTWE